MTNKPVTAQVRVDATRCRAVGICTLNAPTAIELDKWGYPYMSGLQMSSTELEQVGRAVRACPHRALLIQQK